MSKVGCEITSPKTLNVNEWLFGEDQARYIIVTNNGEKIIDRPEDIGIGFLFGGGYSFDYKGKTRYMLGLYLGTSILDDDSIESYVNLVFNGIW